MKKIPKLFFGAPRAATAPDQPSKADLLYRDAASEGGRWYRQSKLLRAVSPHYLARLTRDAGARNDGPMKRVFKAELSRRGSAAARSADQLLLTAMLLVLGSLLFIILT